MPYAWVDHCGTTLSLFLALSHIHTPTGFLRRAGCRKDTGAVVLQDEWCNALAAMFSQRIHRVFEPGYSGSWREGSALSKHSHVLERLCFNVLVTVHTARLMKCVFLALLCQMHQSILQFTWTEISLTWSRTSLLPKFCLIVKNLFNSVKWRQTAETFIISTGLFFFSCYVCSVSLS